MISQIVRLLMTKLVTLLNPQFYDHEYILKTANGLETVTNAKKVTGLMVKGVKSTNWTKMQLLYT